MRDKDRFSDAPALLRSVETPYSQYYLFDRPDVACATLFTSMKFALPVRVMLTGESCSGNAHFSVVIWDCRPLQDIATRSERLIVGNYLFFANIAFASSLFFLTRGGPL